MSRFTIKQLIENYTAVPFIAPFAAFIILLGLKNSFPFDAKWEYAFRVLIVSVILLLVSRSVLPGRPALAMESLLIGASIFLIWIAPDLLWPSYRHHWLFENFVTGEVKSSVPVALHSDPSFLIFRLFGTAILVPIIEELFWRGWLMRYLINANFQKVPLGTFSARAVWLIAILFATEHGPFWDVGLLAGLIYNWWMVRTHNLADCMIAHAVTNTCLAMFVIFHGQWQYWL